MAKEKHRLIDEKEQETTLFYYEILGSIAIIFSITVLGKLGKIGKIFTLCFKVGFGDWYWLIVLFILFFGFFSLFMHRHFEFKNHRFVGFVFIALAVLVYSHFPIHQYVSTTSENYFSSTWAIFKNFINTDSAETLGGGMIGAVIFYGFYYLLGQVGVIFLGVILIILGLSLVFNRSLKEIVEFVFRRFKNIGKYFRSFNRFFRYEVGKDMDKNSNLKKIKNFKLPMKILSNDIYQSVLNTQEVVVEEINKKICLYFDQEKINFKPHKQIISCYVYTLMYIIYSSCSNLILFSGIKKMFNEEIFFSSEDNILVVQIASNDKRILTLKHALQEVNNYKLGDEYKYVIGIDYRNDIITTDINKNGNTLLIGIQNVGIKNYILSMFFQSFFKKSYDCYDYYLFDNLNTFSDLYDLFTFVEDDLFVFLDKIKTLIDERLEFLRKNNITNYQEYLKKTESQEISNKISKAIVIINELTTIKEIVEKKDLFESRLLYLVQLSKKVGITLYYIVRKNLYLNNIIFSVFDNKIIFKCDKELISSLVKELQNENSIYKSTINNTGISNSVLNNSLYLEGFGDAFFIKDNKALRLLPPKVTKEDYDNILEYIKK